MSATCRACPAPILWALMPPKPPENKRAHNPLNVAEVAAEVGKNVIAYNPKTQGGVTVTAENIGECAKWAAGGVTFHTSHFSDCPARKRFRRKKAA